MSESPPGPARDGRDNPLEALGWRATRSGRWIDPLTGHSYGSAIAAWRVINERRPETRNGRKRSHLCDE